MATSKRKRDTRSGAVSARSRARSTQAAARKPTPPPAAAAVAESASQGGRPTAYSDALGRELCKLISLGVPVGVACRTEGIGRRTLYDWRTRGQAGVEPFASFVVALEQALAKAEAAITMHVVRAAQIDWRAGAWWLERRHPGRYGAKQTVRMERAPSEMSEAELDEAIARHGYVRAPTNTTTGDEQHADLGEDEGI